MSEIIWALGGAFGLACLGVGIGNYFYNLKPCEHDWVFEAQIVEGYTVLAHKYRCTKCCKKKEV